MNKRKMTGAIFDMDGTILDSMPIWENVANEYLLRRGITPTEDLNERFKTMSLRQSAIYYQERYAVKETVDEIIAGVNDLIVDAYETTIPLKEGVLEYLMYLKESGVKMALATATDRKIVNDVLNRTGIYHFFDTILTCGEVGSSKEEPVIYNEALHSLGTSKETTIVFEDAYHAICTAKQADYIVAAVFDNAAKENEDKIRQTADYYIETLNEMRNLCYV